MLRQVAIALLAVATAALIVGVTLLEMSAQTAWIFIDAIYVAGALIGLLAPRRPGVAAGWLAGSVLLGFLGVLGLIGGWGVLLLPVSGWFLVVGLRALIVRPRAGNGPVAAGSS